jgi:hypothetical protein
VRLKGEIQIEADDNKVSLKAVCNGRLVYHTQFNAEGWGHQGGRDSPDCEEGYYFSMGACYIAGLLQRRIMDKAGKIKKSFGRGRGRPRKQ